MKCIIRYSFILLLLFTYSLGFNEFDKAVAESLRNGGKLYKKTCSSCHGKKGDKIPPGNFSSAPIAGIQQEELLQILQSYRNGSRDNGGAKGIMSANLMRYKFTNQDLADIAYYVQSLSTTSTKSKDSQTQGYYFQVAAYRGEIPKDILSQIEKYPYIVHISMTDSEPLYRYLIGVYEDYNSMNADKKDITKLTQITHIQKNMKPIVRYLNANNELLEVQDDKPKQIIATASEPIIKETKQESLTFIEYDTQSQDSLEESSKEENKPNITHTLANGYYFILATYAKDIPQATLDKLHSTSYFLHKQNGYTYVMIGGYDERQELLKHTTRAQKLTTNIHTYEQRYEKTRLVYIYNQQIIEKHNDENKE